MKAGLNNLILCFNGAQPNLLLSIALQASRGEPYPIVLQPFDFASQCCPTFHPDNTAIVHMGKYQSIIQSFLGVKW